MKDKKFYYECLVQCQIGYMATDQRRERWEDPESPTMCLHERTFIPARRMRDGSTMPDILALDSPISKRYTEERIRTYKRIDPYTKEPVVVEAPTTVKFRLMDSDEIDATVRKAARYMTLRDCDLAVSDKEEALASSSR